MRLRFWCRHGSWRRGAFAWLLAIALACACSARLVAQDIPASTNGPAAKRIAEIRFRGASLASTDPLTEYLTVKVGDPFTRAAASASIKALFATGLFSDISAETDPAPNGDVVLTFALQYRYFIGDVNLNGRPKGAPSLRQLLNATKLELGHALTDTGIKQAITQMTGVMEDNGYYESSFTYTLKKHEDSRQAEVFFHLAPGPLARVGKIEVHGESGFTQEEVESITKIKPGAKVKASDATRALERLRKKYQKRDLLEAQVTLARQSYNHDSDTVDFIFTVQRGPVVKIDVEGAKLSRGKIKRYVPVYEENAADDDLLNEGTRNLRDYYQSEGYFDVKVNYSRNRTLDNQKLDIVYNVDAGERHSLQSVDVQGNKYFPKDTIRERLSVQTATMLLTHGKFSQAMLARDVAAITALYKTNGFQDVSVKADVEDNYRGKSGDLRIVFRIDEGEQSRVHTLTVIGNLAIPTAEFQPQLSLDEGQPYSEYAVAADRDAIISYYFNRGFPNMDMKITTLPYSGDPHSMDLTYEIHEGTRVFVDRVYVYGLHYTRPGVVAKRMHVHDGDPLSQLDMLDTQRRLYDLGIFSEANVAIQDPDGTAQRRNVIFQLDEARRWTFNYGVGFEFATGSSQGSSNTPNGTTGWSPRFSFELTRLNVFGRDHTFVIKARYGKLEQRGLVSYTAPRLFAKENWRLSLTGFYDKSADVLTFTSERAEGSIQAEQVISKTWTMLYRYSYRRVNVDPTTLQIDPALIPLYSQPTRIGMPGVTVIYDRRDDPIDAHKGMYTTADIGIASTRLGSEEDFSRILVQNSSYYQFGAKHWVFARSLRIGLESPYQNSTLVPLPERFYAGGGNSLRGYSINQAGPRDQFTGYPIGGNALFVNSLELRMPPPTLPFVDDNLSFVFFHDMGNVFDTVSHMWTGLGRLHQPTIAACSQKPADGSNPPPCDYGYLAQAVGLGIRYHTPVGPVRFDIGYAINPTRYPILNDNSTSSTTRVNVFFSIGQTF
ncbi:outer membrane protein assembly factor BamA [Candidatus Korobacter versatilis]|uniref:outer membrane protein assembly factor BamA n=1 Tax=Candidatus Korobacter versatilis TaxID=658062 RepID=UPI0016506279|nr:outer membrane protein assembly factor BamA [Candidatus Koribacter versatilis]